LNKKIDLSDIFPLITEQLENGGSATFVIHGTSMLPLLKDGIDSVRIIKPRDELKKYDIIFYRRDNGQFVLHRIVGIKEGGYVCRGDNQTESEFPVTPENVIGIVSEFSRCGKMRSVDSFPHRFYSKIIVNTVGIKKYMRKIIAVLRRIKKSVFKGSSSR
jgi:signal peptidase I